MTYNLCCISNKLQEEGHKFQTMTFKNFSNISNLSKKILNNVNVTKKIIDYCTIKNWGYRLSSSLFPLINYDKANIKLTDLPDYNEIVNILNNVNPKIRISSHPGEFITLDSQDNEKAIQNSIKDLNFHGWLHDQLNLPRDYRSPINIHLRNNKDDLNVAVKKFMTNYEKLDDSVKSRLVLENNDKGRWSVELLCKYYKFLPITYDNLHDEFVGNGKEKAYKMAANTWKDFKPLFHYSEGIDNSRSHADLPTKLPENYGIEVDFDVELKGKDSAIEKLESFEKKELK